MFSGLRWPGVRGEPVQLSLTAADGAPLPPREFAKLTARGSGARWKPGPVDGSWRDLADIELGEFQLCEWFARRRGDPAECLQIRRPSETSGTVYTSQWLGLVTAMQQAARMWEKRNDFGVSHPIAARKTEALSFLSHPVAVEALAHVRLVFANGALAYTTEKLASFLVLEAALAIERALPMRICLYCHSWFEIRRPGRSPQFCSASCRSAYRQKLKSENWSSNEWHQPDEA
jgi:hypothetical protein